MKAGCCAIYLEFITTNQMQSLVGRAWGTFFSVSHRLDVLSHHTTQVNTHHVCKHARHGFSLFHVQAARSALKVLHCADQSIENAVGRRTQRTMEFEFEIILR